MDDWPRDVTTRRLHHELEVREACSVQRCGRVRIYSGTDIAQVGVNAPERGYSLSIIPAFSRLHHDEALHAPHLP
jgi:hypothetical protein